MATGPFICPEHPEANAPTEEQRQDVARLRAANVHGVGPPRAFKVDNCTECAQDLITKYESVLERR